MSQLLMRRPDLNGLPAVPELPEGYVLRDYRSEDLEPLTALMRAAFEDETWTTGKIKAALPDDPTVKRIFVIAYQGVPVATASARLLPDKFPSSGYIHWVAADPTHQGKGLGYTVSLAVLHEFVRLGCKDAVLETDDFRLAAIKTYQNLGFVPENRHESHPERWVKILADLMAAANM